MDFVPPRVARTFLGLQVVPASGCFGTCLPLQSGVLIIAVIDIIAGFTFEFFKLLMRYLAIYFTSGTYVIPHDISACAPLFAIIGVFGVKNLEADKIQFYSIFKQIEFVVRSVNLLVLALGLPGWAFVVMALYCAYVGYCAFVLWSTHELVRSEEGMFVKHGQGTSQGPSLPY